MKIDQNIPLTITNWTEVKEERLNGITGYASQKVLKFGDIRVRMVEYSENYLADHWCDKGHIIYCINGEMETEVKDGRKFILQTGMTYQVGDNSESHRTYSKTGVKLFVVD